MRRRAFLAAAGAAAAGAAAAGVSVAGVAAAATAAGKAPDSAPGAGAAAGDASTVGVPPGSAAPGRPSPAAPAIAGHARAHVVVLGGGFAGASAARSLRLFGRGRIDVTLVDPQPHFVSCVLSNLVIGGSRTLADLTFPREALARRHGVRLVQAEATAIEPSARRVRLSDGSVLSWDRLVVAPGIDFLWDAWPATRDASVRGRVLHAWKAGPQTTELRRRIEALPDGGSIAIAIPAMPYRCAPAPYERACQAARALQRLGRRGRVIVLDANADIVSKPAQFRAAFEGPYRGIVDYRPGFVTADVDPDAGLAVSDFGDEVKADVLNAIPPQRAGRLAADAGLANLNGRWCEVDYLAFASTQAAGVHVIGDAIQTAPLMPKSGHMASQQGQACAAAIVAALAGQAPDAGRRLASTCYSFVNEREAVRLSSLHAWDAREKTLLPVPGQTRLSPRASTAEGRAALEWARALWADCLG